MLETDTNNWRPTYRQATVKEIADASVQTADHLIDLSLTNEEDEIIAFLNGTSNPFVLPYGPGAMFGSFYDFTANLNLTEDNSGQAAIEKYINIWHDLSICYANTLVLLKDPTSPPKAVYAKVQAQINKDIKGWSKRMKEYGHGEVSQQALLAWMVFNSIVDPLNDPQIAFRGIQIFSSIPQDELLTTFSSTSSEKTAVGQRSPIGVLMSLDPDGAKNFGKKVFNPLNSILDQLQTGPLEMPSRELDQIVIEWVTKDPDNHITKILYLLGINDPTCNEAAINILTSTSLYQRLGLEESQVRRIVDGKASYRHLSNMASLDELPKPATRQPIARKRVSTEIGDDPLAALKTDTMANTRQGKLLEQMRLEIDQLKTEQRLSTAMLSARQYDVRVLEGYVRDLAQKMKTDKRTFLQAIDHLRRYIGFQDNLIRDLTIAGQLKDQEYDTQHEQNLVLKNERQELINKITSLEEELSMLRQAQDETQKQATPIKREQTNNKVLTGFQKELNRFSNDPIRRAELQQQSNQVYANLNKNWEVEEKEYDEFYKGIMDSLLKLRFGRNYYVHGSSTFTEYLWVFMQSNRQDIEDALNLIIQQNVKEYNSIYRGSLPPEKFKEELERSRDFLLEDSVIERLQRILY